MIEDHTAPVTMPRAIELVNLGLPIFKVWTSDPRKGPAEYEYRVEVLEPDNHDVLVMARRDPRVTIIRSPHAFAADAARDLR